MERFPTRCVHAGTMRDDLKKGINSPIYTSTSFEYIDQPDTVYPRYLNTPNEKAVAGKIASLENTESALVFSSGMAAITTVLFAFLKSGDHAVFQTGLYGGTYNFVSRELEAYGIGFDIATDNEASTLAGLVKKNTRLISTTPTGSTTSSCKRSNADGASSSHRPDRCGPPTPPTFNLVAKSGSTKGRSSWKSWSMATQRRRKRNFRGRLPLRHEP